MKKKIVKSKRKLPKPIEKSDLKWQPKGWLTKAQRKILEEIGFPTFQDSFEIWNCGLIGKSAGEWYIPTLTISSAVRSGSRRTYAVGIEDGKTYRIGQGPHVVEQHHVYLTKKNFKRLLPLLKIIIEGSTRANQVRDRISSRRAQGQIYRAQGLRRWYW